MAQNLEIFKRFISLGLELVHQIGSAWILSIQPHLFPFLVWPEGSVLGEKHLRMKDSFLCPFTDI